MTDLTPAERGAMLLDGEKPGWDRLIYINRLDMSSTVNDILGQLYGDYDAGLAELRIDGTTYGFSGRGGEYQALTEEWCRLVTDRLERRRGTPKPPKLRPRELYLTDGELTTAMAAVRRIAVMEPLPQGTAPVILAEVIARMKAEKGRQS
jgi:hypothetical protein